MKHFSIKELMLISDMMDIDIEVMDDEDLLTGDKEHVEVLKGIRAKCQKGIKEHKRHVVDTNRTGDYMIVQVDLDDGERNYLANIRRTAVVDHLSHKVTRWRYLAVFSEDVDEAMRFPTKEIALGYFQTIMVEEEKICNTFNFKIVVEKHDREDNVEVVTEYVGKE